MLKDTCKKKDCFLWKKYKEGCPNYRIHWWQSVNPDGGGGEPYSTEDCTNERNNLLYQDLMVRLLGIQQALEEMRNEFNRVDKNYKQTVRGLGQLLYTTQKVMEIADVQAVSDLQLSGGPKTR